MLIYIIYRIQHCRSAVETMVSPLVTVSPMVDGPSNRCHPGIPRDLRDYQHGWFHLELLMAGWTWLGHTGTLGKCFKKRYQKKKNIAKMVRKKLKGWSILDMSITSDDKFYVVNLTITMSLCASNWPLLSQHEFASRSSCWCPVGPTGVPRTQIDVPSGQPEKLRLQRQT